MTTAPTKTVENSNLTTAFQDAVQSGNTAEALDLIAQGVDVTQADDRGPPVEIAVKHGDAVLMRAIIKAGQIDVNGHNKLGWSLLQYAARDGQVETAQALIDMGADIAWQSPDSGFTALHIAAHYGQPETTRLLLENGADIHATQNKGNTPLHNAAARGRDNAVSVLLAHGADPQRPNEDGLTPYDFAVIQNKLATAALLRTHIQSTEKAAKLIRLKTLRGARPKHPSQ